MQAINPAQINTSIFGMASAVFTSACAMLVTVAIKSNTLVEKTANTLIHGVSSMENVAEAVERRSKIYGDGMVRNGELAERETELKYKLRLANLERQEVIINGGGEIPEVPMGVNMQSAFREAKDSVADSAQAVGERVKITPAIPLRS